MKDSPAFSSVGCGEIYDRLARSRAHSGRQEARVARLVQILFLTLVALGLGSEVRAAEEGREALAREVMDLTGMSEIGAEASASLLAQLKPVFPTVPDELWAEIAGSVSSEEIVRLSVGPFVKHFSEEELSAMIAFYKSSIGKAVLKKMPEVQYETMVIGNEWGQRKATEILEKLKAAGHEPQGM